MPLGSITAKAVTEALIGIFSRNGFPSCIHTDQGSQLTGTMMRDMCTAFGIYKVKTTAYRPQTNGAVERMHGTLVPMLRKAVATGLDWVSQIPLALYAMRLAPHSYLGNISPFEFVYGREAFSPLQAIKDAWLGEETKSLCSSVWMTDLMDKLEVPRHTATVNKIITQQKCNTSRNKTARLRHFDKGDMVLARKGGFVI